MTMWLKIVGIAQLNSYTLYDLEKLNGYKLIPTQRLEHIHHSLKISYNLGICKVRSNNSIKIRTRFNKKKL